MTPRRAMVLAAGLGTRMRPLTTHTAKPLLTLAGRTLLDHALDRLAAARVEHVVVNAHWCADQVAARLAARAASGEGPETSISAEAALLDTGGGVRAALRHLGDGPFYVVNGDAFWRDGATTALVRLAAAFAAGEADDVLLVQRTDGVAEKESGDFALAAGVPRRRAPGETVPFLYAGVHLMAPRILDAMPEGAFSMNLAWDRAMAAGRLRAVVHDGLWLHLSTPPDLAAAEVQLRAGSAA